MIIRRQRISSTVERGKMLRSKFSTKRTRALVICILTRFTTVVVVSQNGKFFFVVSLEFTRFFKG